ncbi:MAG: YtxH domain-containing protein [Saprospiraceae bacterium]|nr:YtxH domain-containing protein [Saprospiraceae bacterium]
MSTGKSLLGLFAGVAAGAALGILLAPDKGSSTRKKISEKGNEYVGDLENKFNKLVDNVTTKFDAARKESARMAENGKAKMDDTLAEANTYLNK